MSNLVILCIHFMATLARLLGPGGVRSIVAESLILKHQLLDRDSLTATIAELMHVGPHPRWLNGTLGTSHSTAPFRNRSETFDTASPSQSHEQAKVPRAVLTESPSEARPERSERRTHPCGRRNEAT